MSTQTKTPRRRVKFQLSAASGSKVFIAASFNHWSPNKNALKYNASAGHYSCSVLLEPGRYEYKFVINGVWCVDPLCVEWAPNEHGSINSILNVE